MPTALQLRLTRHAARDVRHQLKATRRDRLFTVNAQPEHLWLVVKPRERLSRLLQDYASASVSARRDRLKHLIKRLVVFVTAASIIGSVWLHFLFTLSLQPLQ